MPTTKIPSLPLQKLSIGQIMQQVWLIFENADNQTPESTNGPI